MESRAARHSESPDRGELDLVERLSAAVGTALKGKPETIRIVRSACAAARAANSDAPAPAINTRRVSMTPSRSSYAPPSRIGGTKAKPVSHGK